MCLAVTTIEPSFRFLDHARALWQLPRLSRLSDFLVAPLLATLHLFLGLHKSSGFAKFVPRFNGICSGVCSIFVSFLDLWRTGRC